MGFPAQGPSAKRSPLNVRYRKWIPIIKSTTGVFIQKVQFDQILERNEEPNQVDVLGREF